MKRIILAVIVAALIIPAMASATQPRIVKSCLPLPDGQGMSNDKGAPVYAISVRNMSCKTAGRAIQRGRLTAKGFTTSGYACHAIKTYAEGGAIIRCTRASEAFRFTWAT
jgi:hypothetical protein